MSRPALLQDMVTTALADGPGTPEEIAIELGKATSIVRDSLCALARKGRVVRIDRLQLPGKGPPQTVFALPEHAPAAIGQENATCRPAPEPTRSCC